MTKLLIVALAIILLTAICVGVENTNIDNNKED